MRPLVESVAAAEVTLQRAWDGAVRLHRDGEVLAHHGWPTVIRARVLESPKPVASVIVKTYRSWAAYEPSEAGGPASGLFADWAALEFLRERIRVDDAVPELYGGDRDAGVIVMEDVGTGEGLESVLDGTDARAAESSLLGLARVLAGVHAASMREGEVYLERRTRLGPVRDPSEWLGYVWRSAVEVLEALSVERSRAVHSTLRDVRSVLEQPGSWAGLCHAEPGSGNVLVVEGRVWLIDFEGSRWGHVLADAAFPRMAFGHLPATGRLPDDIVRRFENAYLDGLGAVGAAQDSSALSHVAAWLALVNLGTSFRLSFDERKAPFGGARARSQIVAQWRAISRLQDPLSGLAARVLDSLARAWQSEQLAELPVYRSFREAG